MARLVLTRKLDESVYIHDERGVIAVIKVNKVDRNQVRLAITAESDIKVDREEVYQGDASSNRSN
jgi:carbon storage regulator CsrA